MLGAYVNGKFQMFPEATAESYGGVRASAAAYDDSEVPGITRQRQPAPAAPQRQLPAGRASRAPITTASARPLSPRAKIALGIGAVVAAIAAVAWGETRWRDGMLDRMNGKGEGATVPLWSRVGAKAKAIEADAPRKAARAKKRKAKPIEAADEKKHEDGDEDGDEE